MTHTLRLQLPDDVFERLNQAASDAGMTVYELVVSRALGGPVTLPTPVATQLQAPAEQPAAEGEAQASRRNRRTTGPTETN